MLLREGIKTNYNYKEFYIDTIDDLTTIDIKICCPGSIAYIISTSDVYMLNNEKE